MWDSVWTRLSFNHKVISSASYIREYILITGFGFMLFFSAALATVLQTAYLPFGLSSVSLVSLSAYPILLGPFNSALSITHDVKLRQLIRHSVVRDSNFLSSIGNAQMMNELERKSEYSIPIFIHDLFFTFILA
jgi:hypothetical protein